MIDDDIRFFKKHFGNTGLQRLDKKVVIDSSGIAGAAGGSSGGSQFQSRLGSVGIQSTFTRELSPGVLAGFGAADLRGLQKIKDTQADVLEELREEHEKIRKISMPQSSKTSRVSNESSSVHESSSSIREDSRAVIREQREPTSITIQKRFESQLSLKTKRIGQLQQNQQNLQQTIHQLRTELRKKEEAGTMPSVRIKELENQFAVKLEKEIVFFKKETERFIAENTQLKKDLVTKGFEAEELRRTLRQSEDQLRFREEEFKRNLRSLEETMSSKEMHYRRVITEIEKEEKKPLVVQQPSTTPIHRDYESFRRQELSRLDTGPRRNQESMSDEISLFRRLLSEELTKAKEKQFELDRSMKVKLAEIKELEKTLAASRQREVELEDSISHREQVIRRQVERDVGLRVSDREEQLNRKLADREEHWSKKLADAQEQWTRALSEALEREKKSNFEQFQRTFEELGKHKDSELNTLRSHKDTVQRKYTEIEAQHQQSLRRISQEIEQYRNEASKERRRTEQYMESLENAKREENEAKMKNQMLQNQINQLRSFVDQQQRTSKTSSQQTESNRQQVATLYSQSAALKQTITKYEASFNILKAQNAQLQATLSQNTKYVTQLENALKPLQPKRPNIMQQSQAQNWRAREQELTQRIEQLERQLEQQTAYNRNQVAEKATSQEEKLTKLQNEWKRKEEDLQQTIYQLRSRLDGHMEFGNRNRLEIDELKQHIIDAVQSPTQQLRQKQLQFQREIEKLKIQHNQSEESLRRQYRLEIEELTRRLREAEASSNAFENQFEEARSEAIHFEDTITRLRQEIFRKEQIRREEKASLEIQLSRAVFDLETWRRKYETDLPKMTKSGEELLRSLNEKYERDVAGLKVVNQRLMQQAADMLHLASQNQQLVIANRNLQAQVKDKTQAVDHLWSVKQAEYENIAGQIKRVKAVQFI